MPVGDVGERADSAVVVLEVVVVVVVVDEVVVEFLEKLENITIHFRGLRKYIVINFN